MSRRDIRQGRHSLWDGQGFALGVSGLFSREGRGAWPGRAALPEAVAGDCPGCEATPQLLSSQATPHPARLVLRSSLPDATVLTGLVIPFISENKTFVFLDLGSNRQALKKTLRVYDSMIKAVFRPVFLTGHCSEHFSMMNSPLPSLPRSLNRALLTTSLQV